MTSKVTTSDRALQATLNGDASQSRFVLPRRDFVPAYLQAHRCGELGEKVKAAQEQAQQAASAAGLCRLDARRPIA